MGIVYLTIEQAVEAHRKTVEISGGGTIGHLDLGKLESVLFHIQNDDYYPTFEEKLTHLFFSACKFHCFEDGNKRIAIVLCAHMLLLNGYLYCAGDFIRKMENISVAVAAGHIDKELLGEIIAAMVNMDLENEAIKFKIFRALSQSEPLP